MTHIINFILVNLKIYNRSRSRTLMKNKIILDLEILLKVESIIN